MPILMKKKERSQKRTQSFNLRNQKKQTKPKSSIREEIIKTRMAIDELENFGKKEKINKTKSW